ncbi:hypothetical protein LOC67_06580 [Stieleria sp. JC731]|uniref:hypothetical protein n=1 Tax=Pirellulaceae TaxID=2691357 RepID=UPI001E3B5DF4|nr:hypothetical protein [Stieleria sp. JC731]MCC9600220.1 hypothetical protein [Stieleria sp. JC731]
MSQAARVCGAARTFCYGGLCFLFALGSIAQAEEPKVFLVEEDWELVINEPEPAINSPQIAFFMYPKGGREDLYFQLQMNYAAEQGYSSGGFRVGAFTGDQPQDEERSRVSQTLAWDNDRVSWTSAMAVFNNKLMFAVKDGYGYQWGVFGGPDYLVEMDDEGIDSLKDYTPAESLAAVDIGFGSNRVASIRLKTVRLIRTDGSQQTIVVNQFVQ